MAEGKKHTGVYICSGCRIGEAIDCGALADLASGIPSVGLCKQHEHLCSSESLNQITNDIESEKLESLIVAACSSRHYSNEFTFRGIKTKRVNLREAVAWVMEAGNEDSQVAAEDYLRMGITEAENTSLPEAYIAESLVSDILIVGAGISGIQAAIEAAGAGYNVVLLEKSDRPGGRLNELHDIIPASGGKQTNLDLFLGEKLEELQSLDAIKMVLNSEISSIEGEPGAFQIHIKTGGQDQTFHAGSIILANGWKPYDAAKLTALKYAENKNIITQTELEIMAKGGRISRPSDDGEIQNVVFVQCAGSRDKEHLAYCSNVCCLTSLKQAKYIRRQYPRANIFIIYKDIRTPGKNEYFYKEVQEDQQIFLTKGEITDVSGTDSGKIKLIVKDNLLGEEISIQADLVVAATGMVPNPSEELKLSYRKGPGLPERKYGFPDSHFICFPYETQRTGIYACGAVRAPQGIQSCMEDAAGAAVKAIQCVESVKRGEAVHPRPGDSSYPILSMQRCTDCKRCTEECPFGTYDENEKGTPLPHPNRCRRCGICMGSCPERIINFADFNINAVSAMIKSISMPDEFDEKPRILAFVCENDAAPAFDMAAMKGLKISPFVRIIPVRCIGSVNKIWLSDALSAGFDGILQIGCKPGDDYQCHYIRGSELTQTRSQNIQETLQTMMLEPERIKTEFVEIDEYWRIPEIIDDYIEDIEDMGPNPFKGM